MLAIPAAHLAAQTQYTVRILDTPGFLGGNVSSINNGVAAGWAFTNCQGNPGCVVQQIPFAWPDSVTPLNLMGGSNNIQLPSQMQAAQPGLFGGWETDGLAKHAILLDQNGKTDLNGIFFASQVLALCTGYQAGLAQTTPLTNSGGGSQRIIWHAMLWSGDANSWTDLHNQQDISQVQACDGNVQVGYAGSGFSTHAVMWTGTRTSEIDLHSGASQSDQATAVSGSTQAGWGVFQDKNKNQFMHALIWHGAPNTLTDIHPAGFASSAIYGAAGAKQVGWGIPTQRCGSPRIAVVRRCGRRYRFESVPAAVLYGGPGGRDRSRKRNHRGRREGTKGCVRARFVDTGRSVNFHNDLQNALK